MADTHDKQQVPAQQVPAQQVPAQQVPGVTVRAWVGSGDGRGTPRPSPEQDVETVEFVRFCYRRRAVAWPELYDEMCAVAARGDYRGMGYEQLESLGIGFALAALPRLAATVARVVAEERNRQRTRAIV